MPRTKKPEKIPEDWVRCPVCLLKYGWMNCRVSLYDKEGKRYEICLTCACKREREARKSGSSSNGRTSVFGALNGGSIPSDPANEKGTD